MFWELWKESFESIYQNRRRVFLVSIGIAISVSLIIMIFSISSILENALDDYMVSKYPYMQLINCKMNSKEITKEQLINIEKKLPDTCKGVITQSKEALEITGLDEKHTTMRLQGVSSLYMEGMQNKILCGRDFKKNDFSKNHAPVILPESIAKQYFGVVSNALYQTFSVNCQDGRRLKFYVIGVYRNIFTKQQDDNTIICTEDYLYYLQEQEKAPTYISFEVYMNEMSKCDEVSLVLKKLIMEETGAQKDKISVLAADLLDNDKKIIWMFNSLFSLIAIITFAVAGIGIMNVMLVTVKRKSYEIGIKRAIGEQRKWILMQVILETVLICSVGEIMGIFLGSFVIRTVLPGIVAKILNSLETGIFLEMLRNDIKFLFPIKAVKISTLYCLVVSLVFGYLPAKRASKQNIAVALSKGVS